MLKGDLIHFGGLIKFQVVWNFSEMKIGRHMVRRVSIFIVSKTKALLTPLRFFQLFFCVDTLLLNQQMCIVFGRLNKCFLFRCHVWWTVLLDTAQTKFPLKRMHFTIPTGWFRFRVLLPTVAEISTLQNLLFFWSHLIDYFWLEKWISCLQNRTKCMVYWNNKQQNIQHIAMQ